MNEKNYPKVFPLYREGMDLRDLFAGIALNGMLSSGGNWQEFAKYDDCKIAYEIADSMMKARNQPSEEK